LLNKWTQPSPRVHVIEQVSLDGAVIAAVISSTRLTCFP
jgi:hypothetical protein